MVEKFVCLLTKKLLAKIHKSDVTHVTLLLDRSSSKLILVQESSLFTLVAAIRNNKSALRDKWGDSKNWSQLPPCRPYLHFSCRLQELPAFISTS